MDCVNPLEKYTEQNSAPCCSHCNQLKWNHTVHDFHKITFAVLKAFETKKHDPATVKLFKTAKASKKIQLSRYKTSKHWRQAFSDDEFTTMFDKPCTYCQHPKCNGVDRVDSKLHYVVGNCQPCCWTCNTFKWSKGEANFIQKLNKIAEKARKK